MKSIPASAIAAVQPSVISAGGSPLSLNAIFNTQDPSIPIGTVQGFPSLSAVQNWFGAGSTEARRAAIYFGGFNGGQIIPGIMWFAQFNTAAVAGYARGGSVAALSLTQLQALAGTVTLSLDGVSTVSAAINLAAATSFTNAAALVQTGLRAGTPNNTATVTYDSQRAAFVVTSSTTGAASSVSAASVSALATGLKLTTAAGVVLSAGADLNDATTVAAYMANITTQTQNWFTFTNVLEPSDAIKIAFSNWANTTNATYKYVQSDSNVAIVEGPAPESFPALTATNVGTVPIYDPTGGDLGAFECGVTASIDSTQNNGRITFAFKSQGGIIPSINDETSGDNAIANGANFYGAYATAAQPFNFYYPGLISGVWKWDDSYTDQRILNSALQLAFMELLTNVKSIPYNAAGFGLIRAAASDPINQAIAFGSIVSGVTLSNAQIAEVNQAAGQKIDSFLFSAGYYLQITDPGSVVRGQRGSPGITLWYVDGESVQKINMASIDIL